MNELNIANIVEVVPEVEVDATKTPPSGSYMITANKCLYHFKVTMERKPDSDDQASSGTLTLVLAATFTIIPGSIDTDHQDHFDPGTRVWTFKAINGGHPKRTLEFDAIYVGPSGETIVTSADFIVTVPSVGEKEGKATASEGSIITTVERCQTTPSTAPTIEIEVDRIDETCMYRFTFRATRNEADVKDGEVSFKLNNLFLNPVVDDSIDGEFDPLDVGPTVSIWKYGALNEENSPLTASFTALYTGAVGVVEVLSDILSSGIISGSSFLKDLGDKEAEVVECKPPCCEDCDGGESGPIDICPCEQVVTAPVVVAVKPNGRTLSVNLSVPNVCKQRDVNVAVYLFERTYSDEGRTTYTDDLYAVRVVRLEANCPVDSRTGDDDHSCCGCEDRACGCVEFDINDTDDTKCKTRTFIVKTKAHHVFSEPPQMCSCGCSPRSQI